MNRELIVIYIGRFLQELSRAYMVILEVKKLSDLCKDIHHGCTVGIGAMFEGF